RLHFYFIVTARFIKSLKPARNVGHSPIGERLFQQIVDLSAQRFRPINGVSMKLNVAEEILPAFADRNRHIDPACLLTKGVTRLVDRGVEITFSNVKAMD